VTPVVCPVCGLLLGEADDRGRVLVRRRGCVVAVVGAGVVPCRRTDWRGLHRVGAPSALAAVRR
jgi:hypothetical protein